MSEPSATAVPAAIFRGTGLNCFSLAMGLLIVKTMGLLIVKL